MSGLGNRVPEQTRHLQQRASDPRRSVWVSANAGSGKTYVLSRRVIRLLLGGADPSRILCLTYTRSAAANMALRVFGDLARWSTLGDDELAREIAELEGTIPDEAQLRAARRLFARALETPGGLKIQTIHAFCEALLHQFPLEADIAGHFELIDEQRQAELLQQARRDLILAAERREDPGIAAAWNRVLDLGGENGFADLLNEIITQRNRLAAILARFDREGGTDASLRRLFGISAGETPETVMAAVCEPAWFHPGQARAIAAAAAAAGKSVAAGFAADLELALGQEAVKARFEGLCKAFLTERDGEWQPRQTSRIASKGVAEHFPGLADAFSTFAEQLCAARDRLACLQMIEATAAAMTLSSWLIFRYEGLKRAHGYLDFEDLIARTAELLSRAEAGAWVQYKLDRGLDHILIDEAQDTSPDQWQVIRKLAEEFFAGQSARTGIARTLFAVGDEKQSIYSFQGAEPAAFAETGAELAQRVGQMQRSFERVHLRLSFRSVGDVLSAVDLVFRDERARKGLTLFPEEIDHPAIRANDPGHVEIWPQFSAQKAAEPSDWTEPIDHASAPAVRLAEAVAERIRRWLREGEILPGRGRPVRPGDVMILVRKRDSFVHALSRSLKMRGIAVAGADRLRLSDHIAVKDLIALGRFAIQPEDDLSLAALLKSPIFNFTDEDLFRIAHERGRRSLWRSLLGNPCREPRFRDAAEKLSRWRVEAGRKSVHGFYSGILGRDGVRAALLARLGAETAEILDEFVSFILACERPGPLGPASFLETLESAAPEIKREIAQSRDEVRIMTVHAAKGLEAPVVFLADNGSKPFDSGFLPRLLPWRQGAAQPQCYLWRAGKSLRNRISQQLEQEYREKQEEEYRRLLYVGMTRAEDRLIVCGYHGLRPPDEGTWHRLVTRALQDAPGTVRLYDDLLDCEILRHAVTPLATTPQTDRPEEQPQELAREVAFPPELLAPLPPDPELPLPLAPSRLGVSVENRGNERLAGQSPVLGKTGTAGEAAERGIAVHKLLQFLPAVPLEEREARARAWLARFGRQWPESMVDAIWRSVSAILDDERFAELFREGSQPEVTIAGNLTVKGRIRALTGRIDRLAVTTREVLFVDYKTGGNPPLATHDVPAPHVTQLALYGAMLQRIYPGRRVRAGLLYTEGPVLLEPEEERLARALELLAVA